MGSTLASQVYAELLDALRLGEIQPHHRLVDTDLAAERNISRMPVREALLRLASEGYLVSTTRGFTVPTLSLDEIRDLSELRRQLEPRAAANAARDMNRETEAVLGAAMGAIRAAFGARDLKALLRANLAFRSAWLGAIGNRILATTTERYMDQFQTIRPQTFEDPHFGRAYMDGLEGIYDAFLRRDPLLAGDRMMNFMYVAEAAFLAARRAQLDEAAEVAPAASQDNTTARGTE
ncbi:GntR family transcriptional regulator [Nitratireductor soli]|uniref:GntR family transcriptional regulator n=1 Tax=Nitratireductor soli TaxID=1670619 RepID=UPI00065DFCEC|nr:GntR family transcriptional regulator [Nitratireductor soli]